MLKDKIDLAISWWAQESSHLPKESMLITWLKWQNVRNGGLYEFCLMTLRLYCLVHIYFWIIVWYRGSILLPVYKFSRAGGFKEPKCILSKSGSWSEIKVLLGPCSHWRLSESILSRFPPSFQGLPAVLQWFLGVGSPWLVHSSLQSLPMLSHGILPVCLSVT